MIAVTYEVYRFRKWWKNSFTRLDLLPLPTEEDKIKALEKLAYKRDLWKIRNLTYMIIKNV